MDTQKHLTQCAFRVQSVQWFNLDLCNISLIQNPTVSNYLTYLELVKKKSPLGARKVAAEVACTEAQDVRVP